MTDAIVVCAPDAVVTIAAAINVEHDAARASVAQGLAHARRAGELLQQAKTAVPHGEWLPWLTEHCPNLSERTAQSYMRLARCWTQLESVNPQRVADLSLREAMELLAWGSARLSALPEAQQHVALDEADMGQRFSQAIRRAKIAAYAARTFTPPPALMPLTTTADRRRRLRRHEEDKLWQVQIGPNAVGRELPQLLAAERESPAYTDALAAAAELRADADRLERLAKEARAAATQILRDADADVRDALHAQHGAIYSMCETFDLRVVDPERDAWLKQQSTTTIIDWLLAHRGLEAREVGRGFWGDLQLMRFSSHQHEPVLNPGPGGWTSIGSMESVWGPDESSQT